MPDINAQDSAESQAQSAWRQRLWSLMDVKVGIIPVPLFVTLLAIILTFSFSVEKVPNDILMAMGIMAIFGFTCAEIGKRIPILKNIGGAAIAATFVPSALVYYHMIPENLTNVVSNFTRQSNFLYLFIAAIIVGSILGMDREVLVRSFLKIFLPLIVGTVAALAVGTLVGALVGIGAYKALFFVVIPILAGGVGEGAIPLSIGYSEILGEPQSDVFATILPCVMLGSLTAILMAGSLNYLGRKRPSLTGEGRVSLDDHTPPQELHRGTMTSDLSLIAAGGLLAVTLFLLGNLSHSLLDLPAPVVMLFLAVLIKLARLLPPSLETGAYTVYRFFHLAVTYPLLFAVGVALTPWDKLMAAFHLANLVTIVSTVATLIAVGFFMARWLRMYPLEVAIINACHSGQGGTGDVAILTAANRMMLMPFAQVATRIGGAITVTVALLVFAQWH
ncbi:MAG: 2-hydroxycarboxylate transporter family protein [Rhodospirillales bacterium]